MSGVVLAKLIDIGFLVISAIFTMSWRKVKTTDQNRQLVLDALAAGVEYAWDIFGREAKAMAQDGKFSGEEREKLRQIATEEAKRLLAQQGLDLAKMFGQSMIDSFIKDVVQSRKLL